MRYRGCVADGGDTGFELGRVGILNVPEPQGFLRLMQIWLSMLQGKIVA